MRTFFRAFCFVMTMLCLPAPTVSQEQARAFHGAETAAAVVDTVPQVVQHDTVSADVLQFFPKATHLTELGHGWIAVMKDRKHLGYVAYSKPASDGIKGYRGETPLLIAFDKDHAIKGVKLLPNQETPGFVNRVEAAGFFDSWNGLKIKKAIDKTPDVVSGATYTSRAVTASMKAALTQLGQVTPSVVTEGGSWGTILIVVCVLLLLWLLRKKWVTITELIFRKDKKKKSPDTLSEEHTTKQ